MTCRATTPASTKLTDPTKPSNSESGILQAQNATTRITCGMLWSVEDALSPLEAAADMLLKQHVYWLHQCPGSATNGDFKLPQSNDIPSSCKQIGKGVMKNLWCWAS